MIFLECCIFVLIGLMLGFLIGKKSGYTFGYESGVNAGFVEGWDAYDKEKTIIISDDLPEKPTKKNLALKLQNELKNYIVVTDNKVEIKVVIPTEDQCIASNK